jgi:hypothetical protein
MLLRKRVPFRSRHVIQALRTGRPGAAEATSRRCVRNVRRNVRALRTRPECGRPAASSGSRVFELRNLRYRAEADTGPVRQRHRTAGRRQHPAADMVSAITRAAGAGAGHRWAVQG